METILQSGYSLLDPDEKNDTELSVARTRERKGVVALLEHLEK